jgi:hypothetical protein
MRNSFLNNRRRIWAAGVALALGLAACGGGGDGPEPAQPQPQPVATPAPEPAHFLRYEIVTAPPAIPYDGGLTISVLPTPRGTPFGDRPVKSVQVFLEGASLGVLTATNATLAAPPAGTGDAYYQFHVPAGTLSTEKPLLGRVYQSYLVRVVLVDTADVSLAQQLYVTAVDTSSIGAFYP